MSTDPTPDAAPGQDASSVSGEAAKSGNAAENRDGVSDKDPKTLKKEGEKALEEGRKAALPKAFDS